MARTKKETAEPVEEVAQVKQNKIDPVAVDFPNDLYNILARKINEVIDVINK